MASRSKKKLFLTFDAKAYLKDLMDDFKSVYQFALTDMKKAAKAYLKGLPWHSNEVKMADGSVTSDRERAAAVINSLWTSRVTRDANKTLRGTFEALNKNFEDSHVGLYYEWGTGEAIDPEATYESLASPTPYRNKGEPIRTRSKYYNNGYGDGLWRDIGGNLRKTNAPKGGVRNPKFVAYIGDDVEAYHWFEKAFNDIAKDLMDQLGRAIQSRNIARYMRICGARTSGKKARGKFILGKD